MEGNSLEDQWLGLSVFAAEGPGSIPGRGSKILQAMQCGQKTAKTHTRACMRTHTHTQNHLEGFAGGPVVKNPPANAGDMGSNLGLGRSHMPRSNYARAPQLLSLHSTAHVPQLLSPRATTTEVCAPRAHDPQQEKPPQ